jgi:predicted ArsR family transcriptional regulator
VSEHPIHDLDDDVHQRVRLGILASLHGVARADFTHLKTTLGVTDGNLGRHLQALEEAGLISQHKTAGQGRPRTWVKITSKGRHALRAEVRALQRLLGTLDEPAAQDLSQQDQKPARGGAAGRRAS